MLTATQIIVESSRCLQCYNAPCEQGCPVHIPIPRFIRMIKTGNLFGAAEEVKAANNLANICGRICPQEIFCQSVCSRLKIDEPVAIRELHDFVTSIEWQNQCKKPGVPGLKSKIADVAILGSGVAGISCAYELRKIGVSVELFDVFEEPGGIPTHVIPEWRMDREGLTRDLEFLEHFLPKTNVLKQPVFISEVRENFKAVFLATGLWLDRRLEVPGEEMEDVYHAIDYLSLAKLKPEKLSLFDRVVVVGGGNVSLDVATTAKMLGATEVTLTYRRSPAEMKTWKAEKKAAEESGVQFAFQVQPVKILGIDNRVAGLLCHRTVGSENNDSSNRRMYLPDESTRVEIPADAVIVSIGQNSSVQFDVSIKQDSQGVLKVNENFMTTEMGVFAGGDLIRGEGTVVQAVADGQKAAHAIVKFINK